MRSANKPKLRRFHQARWDEPIIFELSNPGERGVLVPEVEEEIRKEVGEVLSLIPEGVRRQQPPHLPEMGQPQVLRHYVHLAQETLGTDYNIDVGQGTCTMKYSPRVHEQLARLPQITALHPLQDEDTVQGILEIMYQFEQFLKEISGMDRFSLQPGAGSAAIYTNAAIVRAYHEDRGEADQRDEIITTIFSHPSDAACPKTAGYKIVTLYQDEETGYPSIEALKAAVSNRTAGIFITNPEDTGIFNSEIEEFVKIVHEVGGLCVNDQANANGLLGITRARDAGFDMCSFNLHKTFSAPHGCGGPASGASGVTNELKEFLPTPIIEFDGKKYRMIQPQKSIGKVRAFFGVVPVILKAYTWVMSLGAAGLKEVAQIAVLNNNYLFRKVLEIPGASAPYAKGKHRIEQVRYSWKQLTEDTGVHSEELGLRAADFGVHYWTSHHPFIVPEPCTLEPTESYTKAELDEYIAILRHVANEAYTTPNMVKTAPHNSTIHKIHHEPLDDPSQWALTWRAYLRKVQKKGKQIR